MLILIEGLSTSSRESTQIQRLECVAMFENSRDQRIYSGVNNGEYGRRGITGELFGDKVM